MKVQSHRRRGETGKGKENERKMKVQSHRGRGETGKGKENERQMKVQRLNEGPAANKASISILALNKASISILKECALTALYWQMAQN